MIDGTRGAAESAGTVRDPLATAAASVGGLGAGVGFMMVASVLAHRTLTTGPVWGHFTLTWNHAVPLVLLTVVVLVAATARRWGWLVAAVGLAGQIGLDEMADRGPVGPLAFPMLVAVAGGLILGGALAAFGAASRTGRLAIVLGHAVGMTGGWVLAQRLLLDLRDEPAGVLDAHLILLGGTALLAAVAVVIGLVRPPGPVLPGRWRRAARFWAACATAVVTIVGLHAGLLAHLSRRPHGYGSSSRDLYLYEGWHEIGSIMIAIIAASVLCAFAYYRAGPRSARWVVVAAAGGLAGEAGWPTGTWTGAVQLGAVAVVGVAAGALLARLPGSAAPWDAVGLGGLAVCVGLMPSGLEPGLFDTARMVTFPLTFMIGLAMAAALVRLVTDPDEGAGDDAGVWVALGLVMFLLAATVAFPARLLAGDLGESGVGLASAIVSAAVIVVWLHWRMPRAAQASAEGPGDRE